MYNTDGMDNETRLQLELAEYIASKRDLADEVEFARMKLEALEQMVWEVETELGSQELERKEELRSRFTLVK